MFSPTRVLSSPRASGDAPGCNCPSLMSDCRNARSVSGPDPPRLEPSTLRLAHFASVSMLESAGRSWLAFGKTCEPRLERQMMCASLAESPGLRALALWEVAQHLPVTSPSLDRPPLSR
ncbi:unnamed protein product [Cercospora beticola]|nr:unnamed protein product [Cercospora beticola]